MSTWGGVGWAGVAVNIGGWGWTSTCVGGVGVAVNLGGWDWVGVNVNMGYLWSME